MSDAEATGTDDSAKAPPTLADRLGVDGGVAKVEKDGMETVLVPAAAFADAAKALSDDGYTRFLDLSVVDHVESGRADRFEVYLVAYNMEKKAYGRLKAFTTGTVPSVTDVYHAANAYEREVFDLFGLQFPGHPSLTRIMLPEGWQGHPLRRDADLPIEPVDFTVTRDLYNT
jgi:NADH-quinone oxidoreductase subunit C